MRKIVKDFTAIPLGLQGANFKKHLADCLVEHGKHDFKLSIYRHKTVITALNAIYENKCAFCESDTTAGAPLQVEHFRPKAKVTESPEHPGYYWLGYQWCNLLYSCSTCNVKKKNFFPVSNPRANSHPVDHTGQLDEARCHINGADLMAENHQLVNPEIDPDPMRHFYFQYDGLIVPSTAMGKTTIQICDLNRDVLKVKRKDVYETYMKKFIRHFEKYYDGIATQNELLLLIKDTIEDLKLYIDQNKPYSEFARQCYEKFPVFYISRFQPQDAVHLLTAYREVG